MKRLDGKPPSHAKTATCRIWPDGIPRVDHSGKKVGMMTVLYPVYQKKRPHEAGWVWFYLGECGLCKKELIYRCVTSTKSCGCARIKTEAIKREAWRKLTAEREARLLARKIEAGKHPKINRLHVCHRHGGQYECQHYNECLSAMCGETGAEVRYRARGCYVAGKEQVKFETMLGDGER